VKTIVQMKNKVVHHVQNFGGWLLVFFGKKCANLAHFEGGKSEVAIVRQ